jgi:hypothetical protein
MTKNCGWGHVAIRTGEEKCFHDFDNRRDQYEGGKED